VLQTPPQDLALPSGVSIAKVAGNSCVWAAPELLPPLLLELCHLHPIQKSAIISLLLICKDLEKIRIYQEAFLLASRERERTRLQNQKGISEPTGYE